MRIKATLPGVATLGHYDRRWLRGDLMAGKTVAAYLVPQVLAYAALAGLPPVAGLWASLPALAAYAMHGTSRLLSAGPESTTALMTAVVVGPLAAGDPRQHAALAATLAVAVGGLCLVSRLLRLGVVADLLSRPTLVGYLAGLALIMIASQLGKLTGITVHGDTFLAQMTSFLTRLPTLHLATTVFAAAVLAFLLVLQRFAAGAPGPLLAVLLATTVVAVFGLDRHGVRVIGAIPSGIPVPALPDVLLAVALSVAEMLVRVARPHDAVQGLVPGLAGMHDVDDYPQARTIPGLVVYRYDSPLFFANAENFRRRALAAVNAQDSPVAWFVLNMEANVEVDITALEAVEQLRQDLRARGIVFALARVKQDLLVGLEAFGLVGHVGADLIFPTLPTAVAAYQKWRAGRVTPELSQPTRMTGQYACCSMVRLTEPSNATGLPVLPWRPSTTAAAWLE